MDLIPGPGEDQERSDESRAIEIANDMWLRFGGLTGFRETAKAAYRAGREDAAKAVEAVPEHPEMVPNAAEEWQNGYRWGWYYAIKAVREVSR